MFLILSEVLARLAEQQNRLSSRGDSGMSPVADIDSQKSPKACLDTILSSGRKSKGGNGDTA